MIGKLDYIKELGADYIWLTPFFVSPQNDNGYDVEDYYNIDPRYGTMADVEELIAEADKRGIGLMFDMVFNHVSHAMSGSGKRWKGIRTTRISSSSARGNRTEVRRRTGE